MLGLKKRPLASADAVGAGSTVHGDYQFSRALTVAGVVLGNVTPADDASDTRLVLAEGGHVEGRLKADHIVIAGSVQGPVFAHQKLELMATARIEGDVSYRTLQMHPGAVVSGQLRPDTLPVRPAQKQAPAPEYSSEQSRPAKAEVSPVIEPTLDLD